MLRHWFLAAGAQVRASSMGLGAFRSGLFDTLSLMTCWSSCWIVLEIDMSLIQGGDPTFFNNRHWVVVRPRQHPIAWEQPCNTPIPLEQVRDEMMKIAAQRVKDGAASRTWTRRSSPTR